MFAGDKFHLAMTLTKTVATVVVDNRLATQGQLRAVIRSHEKLVDTLGRHMKLAGKNHRVTRRGVVGIQGDLIINQGATTGWLEHCEVRQLLPCATVQLVTKIAQPHLARIPAKHRAAHIG